MVLRVIGALADPLCAIDQALLDVVADVPPRQLGEGSDLVEREFPGGAHGLFIRHLWCLYQVACIMSLGIGGHPEVVPESECVRRSMTTTLHETARDVQMLRERAPK